MGCAACGGKSRRPMRTTQGGQPVNQNPVQRTGTATNDRASALKQRVGNLKWGSK